MFRPHPGLEPALEQADIMSRKEFRNFFASDRCYLYEGPDYDDVFRWSDVLISDASSFLVQYAPTRRPVIYLHREDGWSLDDSIKDDVFAGYYVARSELEVTTCINKLARGCDDLAEVRIRCQ